MQVQNDFYKKAYYGTTMIDPMGVTAVVGLGILMLALPRRLALVPLIALICFIPATQRVSVFGLDFNLMRILLIFGWTRVYMRGEYKALRISKLDKLLVAWAAVETTAYFALYLNGGAIVTMCGRMGEALGGYFLVRIFVRSWDDMFSVARWTAILAVPVGVTFIIEKFTGRNVFSVFGGVAEYTGIREGRLRATGALGNPILAGCYWAALVPMMAALMWHKKNRVFGFLGALSGVIVVIACASSTPLGALMAAFAGGAAIHIRHKMGSLRKGVFWTLAGLHLVMNKPVWHLLSRIDLVGGSTGYHRFYLIDMWIAHFREWAVRGVKGTSHWGWGLADVTNQYVLESVRGGLATFILFVMVIATAYGCVGRAWRMVEEYPERLAMAWALGVCIFTHCMSFIAVSYFGQMNFGWYMSLALGVCMMQAGEELLETSSEQVAEPEATPAPGFQRKRRLLGAT